MIPCNTSENMSGTVAETQHQNVVTAECAGDPTLVTGNSERDRLIPPALFLTTTCEYPYSVR